MSVFKTICSHCRKELRINDPIIEFEKSNIYHQSCYRMLLESRYQEPWFREIGFLNQIKNFLTKSISKIKVIDLSLDSYKLIGPFDRNIVLLNRITDTCKGINFIQKDRLKKSLECCFKKLKKFMMSFFTKNQRSTKMYPWKRSMNKINMS